MCIDCDAELEELGLDTVERIGSLSPFGRANPRPAVRLQKLALVGAPRQIGANGRHLTITVRPGGSEGQWLRAVWFGEGGRAADLAPGMAVDVVIEPKINAFNGRTTVEGIVRDVRPREA